MHFQIEKINMKLMNIYLYYWGANTVPELMMEIGYVKLHFFHELLTRYVNLKLSHQLIVFWVDSQNVFLNWAVWNWKLSKRLQTLPDYYNYKQPSFLMLSFIVASAWEISKLKF